MCTMAIAQTHPTATIVHKARLQEARRQQSDVRLPITSKQESASLRDCCQATGATTCNACLYCADECQDKDCRQCCSSATATASIQKQQPKQPFFFGQSSDDDYYTICQVRRHDTVESAWLLVGDTIYDATTYLQKHPGGTDSILKKAGGKVDCTVDFDFHSKRARKMWKDYKVGKLCPCRRSGQQHGGSSFGTDEQCVIS